MARKNRDPRSIAHWTDEDLVELIAWLDHSLQHEEISFEDTVVGHLRRTRHKEYSITQIRSKLSRSWWSHGSDSSEHWHELYKCGSSILLGLGTDMKSNIAISVGKLEDTFVAWQSSPRRSRRRRDVANDRSQSKGPTNPKPSHDQAKAVAYSCSHRVQSQSARSTRSRTVKRDIELSKTSKKALSIESKRLKEETQDVGFHILISNV